MAELPKVQLLVATMDQTDWRLVDKLGVRSGAVIANQGDRQGVERLVRNEHEIVMVHSTTRGVGKNRNIALEYADADFVLLADDDMVYEPDYVEKVREAFKRLPDADLIFFNLHEENQNRVVNVETSRVRWHNLLRYGAARTAVRLSALKKAGISFNEHFGGGTEHSHGEDTIFFADCLRAGMRLYAVPEFIATLTDERPSTWLQGYDEKYLRDQGALYKAMSPRLWRLWAAQDAVRRAKRHYNRSALSAYKLMRHGARSAT